MKYITSKLEPHEIEDQFLVEEENSEGRLPLRINKRTSFDNKDSLFSPIGGTSGLFHGTSGFFNKKDSINNNG